MKLLSRFIVALCVVLATVPLAEQAQAQLDRKDHWFASWAAAPQAYVRAPAALAAVAPPVPVAQLADLSLRQVMHPTLAGPRIRIRFSNRFGKEPLHIASASVARSAEGANVVPASLHALRFGGHADLTIAPGAQAWSDATGFAVDAGQPVSVSFRIDAPVPVSTVHQIVPGATWVLPGDAVMQAEWSAARQAQWNHIVTGLDVAGPGATRVVVAFGDSITEGAGAKDEQGQPVRYPERLAARLQERHERATHGPQIAVVNAGISGNRLLADWAGPKAIGRFRGDVLGQSGVTHVVILIGINDIGLSLPEGANAPVVGMPSAQQLIAGLQQLVEQARAGGVKVLLGTLTPFKGAGYWSPEKEARRQAVNDWIRQHRDGGFAIADFDAALRDPADPQAMKADADSGDHLHPGNAGYAAMADAVDLNLLRD